MPEKVAQWLDKSTRLAWVLWPETRSVTVHRPGEREPPILHENDALEGEDVAPGFTCGVGELF